MAWNSHGSKKRIKPRQIRAEDLSVFRGVAIQKRKFRQAHTNFFLLAFKEPPIFVSGQSP
jgi:hypothetical protein